MTDLESNIQAYRTMAEVLVNLRKIIVRGLQRVSGEAWYLDGCPPGVYERLVERKESELAIQRLSTEYEDLISFATFADLAEIVEFNEDLARLLRNLAPSTELLCARLLELEALRSKLAQGRDLSVEEITVITNYSTNLVAALAGARRRTAPAREVVTPSGEPPAPEAAEEPPDTEVRLDEEPAAAPRIRDESTVAVPIVEQEPAREQPAPVIEEEFVPMTDTPAEEDRQDLAVEEAAPAADTAKQEQTPDDEPAPPITTAHTEFEAIAADIENALADGEARDVLRVLRREVIAVAEAVYRLDEEIVPPGWQRVRKNGWLDARNEEFGLEPLAEFHGLVEEYQVGRAEGLDQDQLRGMLSSRKFSRLLLTLREMFLRNGV
jgi:hypothetical protein